jgi:hypothetical protein
VGQGVNKEALGGNEKQSFYCFGTRNVEETHIALQAYVELSRSRTRETVRLVRDFDEILLVNHPCTELTKKTSGLRRCTREHSQDFGLASEA